MVKTSKIRAIVSTAFRDEIEAIAINPGDWWGKCWLVEIGVGYSSSFYIVEANSCTDAIDEFSGSEYGHHILISDSEMAYYNLDSVYYNDGGQPCDLDNLSIVDCAEPRRVVYHGDSLPPEGIPAEHYRGDEYDREEYAALNWLREHAQIEHAEIRPMIDDIQHGEHDVCGILADRLDDYAPDGSLGMVSAGLRKLPNNRYF